MLAVYLPTSPTHAMAFRFNVRTHILLSSPRAYLVTPEGSTCPLKLSDAERDRIADTWRKVQDFHRIGQARGTLYSRPTS